MSRYIRLSELWGMIKTHFFVALAAALFGMAIIPFMTGSVTKYIFSTIFILIYILALYTKGETIARRDKKAYTESIPYWWKGFILPVGILVIWAVLYALYAFSWKYDIVGNTSGLINNMLFVTWNFMYTGFLNINNGKFNYLCIIFIMLIPVAASEIGYFAGYKGFDLSLKVSELVYEKKEEKDTPAEKKEG